MMYILLKTFIVSGKKLFPLAFLLFAFFMQAFSQKGPGGVSVETGSQSTCRLWFDASRLTLADGAYVGTIPDISPSAIADNATHSSSDRHPRFRNDPTVGINGQPVLIFNQYEFLQIASSTDVNNYSPHTHHTYAIVFNSGSDVTSRQVLYEQGGDNQGFNMEINSGRLYFTAYDVAIGVMSSPPKHISEPIQANSNYIFIFEFFAPNANPAGGFMRGYVNGTLMSSTQNSLRAVGSHTDPAGIGAVNSDMRNYSNGTPSHASNAFSGKLAELMMYSDTLSKARRIILENYLGAKYGEDIITNDIYPYKTLYPNELIGIGKEDGAHHERSQGFNIFEISATPANLDNGEYLLTGHNGAGLNAITTNIPNNSTNTKRIAREWRFTQIGDVGPVQFRVHTANLPALGNGFTKYVLIVDKKAEPVSNFAGNNVDVYELEDSGNGIYKATSEIPDGAYVTIGLIKPEVAFAFATSYGFEDDTDATDSVLVKLNYIPVVPHAVDYYFTNGTALLTDDYIGADDYLDFPMGENEAFIDFTIVGDTDPENTEKFYIHLTDGANTTAGLGIGSPAMLEFSIYDNDNDPEVSFALDVQSFNEDEGIITIDVVRSGITTNEFTVDVHLSTSRPSGTATLNVDYLFTPVTLAFATGETVKQITVEIIDDNLDEVDETIYLELSNVQGGVDLVEPIIFELTIIDNDAPPTVQFLDAAYFAPETFAEPDIRVVLSAPSTKIVTVEWERTGGTATPNLDFICAQSGILSFAPGETSLRIPILNLQDAVFDPNETVEFELLENANLTNATLGTPHEHIYTIKDYSVFEWKGPGGVGDIQEVSVWMDASRETFSNGLRYNPTNFGNSTISLSSGSGDRPYYQNQGADLINGMPVFRFTQANGTYTTITESGITNGTADYRDYFMVIRTGNDVNSRQTIYDGGSGRNGLNIYINNGNLFFHLHSCDQNWGVSNSSNCGNNQQSCNTNLARYVSAPVTANTNYIVHLKFDHQLTYSEHQIEMYFNGVKVDGVSHSSIKTHNGHEGHRIGREINTFTHLHSACDVGNAHYRGMIGEFIYYSNSPINTTRKRLIENYLSAKYKIPVPDSINSATIHPDFGRELAGIGKMADSVLHLDAQGYGNVRVRYASDLDDDEYLVWHSNNGSVSSLVTTLLPTCVHSRIQKIWAVNEIGEVGNVTLSIDLTGLNISGKSASDFELLIHSESDPYDFRSASRYKQGTTLIGNIINFPGVNLNEGDYFSVTMDAEIGISGLWTGNVSTDWHNILNWSCEIPDKNTIVTIPNGRPYYPEILNGFTGECMKIFIDSEATLNVKSGGTLEINKD